MNKIYILLFSCMLFCSSCSEQSRLRNSSEEFSSTEKSEYTEVFDNLGFSITTPCLLEDVSAHSSGDFVINYGGVENPDDSRKMAAYQIIVTSLPVSYKKLSKAKLDGFIDDALKNATRNLTNVEKINFGNEGYPGYVGYTNHNGLRQKGLMFVKDKFIVALTLMTNDNLEEKFNKFTNGFKTLVQEENSNEENNSIAQSNLPERFQHSRFSINYPKSWDIVQKDVRANAHTNIAVQVMDQEVGEYDFASNVNVIVSSDKHSEATSTLARISFNQVKDAGLSCSLIGIKDCNLNGCKGSVAEYTANIQGFTLHIWQYIVKKNDNTTLTLTATIDHMELPKQKKVISEIVNSFVVK